MKPLLLRNRDHDGPVGIEEYRSQGGYKAFTDALAMEASAVLQEVRVSGLRGRGGAGFPTGMKWLFASSDPAKPKYLVCNADEGEPGTFKDKAIIEKDPHLLIEGMLISAYAIGASRGYIYLRAEYPKAGAILGRALEEALAQGFLGDRILGSGFSFRLALHHGAGAYICGEETALLESMEGRRGQPRVKPPFPVNSGLSARPTVINNVETLANIPRIIEMGGEAYAKIGSPYCPGTKLFSVSGRVKKPGLYELPMGVPLRELIYTHAGGIEGDRGLKAVIPGGVSTPVLPAERIDCAMDFVSLPKAGSQLGSGAVIVFDDSDDMVAVCWRILCFFEHESCGKCTPCREGVGWLKSILERLCRREGRPGDLDLLGEVARNIRGMTFCALGDGAAGAVLGFLEHFSSEFKERVPGIC